MTGRRSTRRKIQAEGTRREILAAARRLFAERGYAATSMSAIAEEAGAAVQTVYDSVGPKRAILLALNDVIDEEAGVAPMWRRLGETNDPRETIALTVRLTRRFSDRCGDILMTLMAAAPSEPDVAQVVGEGHRRHREGTRQVAFRLAEVGALRLGLSPERAGAILGALTWVDTYRNLIQDYGWTFDECEAWLVDALSTLLLRPAA
jgi:AcrR family transcriptional regulator